MWYATLDGIAFVSAVAVALAILMPHIEEVLGNGK